jgi:CDP-diglyceride synthetase
MKPNGKKSFLKGIPSWALSLITVVFSFILLFLLAYPFGEVIGYISYDIVIVIACFFICRKNPTSIWYVPIICNIVGIIAAFGEENFYWASTLWIIICGGWVLSIFASILGAWIGKRKVIPDNH